MLVHNVAEMQTLVDRTLEYEKTPFMGEEWFDSRRGHRVQRRAPASATTARPIGSTRTSSRTSCSVYGFPGGLGSSTTAPRQPAARQAARPPTKRGNPNANDMVQLVNKGASPSSTTPVTGTTGASPPADSTSTPSGRRPTRACTASLCRSPAAWATLTRAKAPETASARSGSSTPPTASSSWWHRRRVLQRAPKLGTADERPGRDGRPRGRQYFFNKYFLS